MIPIAVWRVARLGLLCAALSVGTGAWARDAPPIALRQAVAEAVVDEPGAASFYRERAFAPLWATGDEAGAARVSALLRALERAGDHGLPATRWDAQALRAGLVSARTTREVGAAEGALTRAFLDYATALTSGLLEPGEVVPLLVREVPRPDAADLLRRMEGPDPARALRSVTPSAPEYGRLMRQRAALERTIAAGGWGPPVEADALEPGQEGAAVVALRDRLRAMGFMGRSASPSYDAALRRAVTEFQERSGLAVDGVAGPATLAALNVPPEMRLGQVLVAMERERWTNFDRGRRHVWVNLADFSAAIVDEGAVTFRTRAVIGKDTEDRETPEFSDVMEHMVVNPSWYVPRSIVVGEYLPKLRRDPWAVSHIEMTDSRGRSVDRSRGFTQYSERSFPFAMRQPPGPSNALGRVKFMFPNSYNIYLHDTPQKHLFDRDRRAFSHGCVRLADPFEFAYALLAPQEEEPERFFQRVLASEAETRVVLDEPVPVHLVYRTAFTDAEGRLHTREDVYGRDARILDALMAAGAAPGV